MMSAYPVSRALLFLLLDVGLLAMYLALAGYAWLARLIRRFHAR